MNIEHFRQTLPHGITLECRAAGPLGAPVLLFLHGFPQGAFVWDFLLAHFSEPAHGGYRCVAPYLRGFGASSAPADVSAYRPKHLVQDVLALIDALCGGPQGQLAALVAHDWGGAVAWNLANQYPQRLRKLVIVNSPHPGTFLRELKGNAAQQAASAYMNFLIRPDAEALLAQDDYRRLWEFLTRTAQGTVEPAWLTEQVRAQHRAVWELGLHGGCNYYRASPLRPPTAQDPAALAVELPESALHISVPTLVLWGMDDVALPGTLLDGLQAYVPALHLQRVQGASHWILHEQPELVQQSLETFLSFNKPQVHPQAGP